MSESVHIRLLRDFLDSLPAELGSTRRIELRDSVKRMLNEGWFQAPAPAPEVPATFEAWWAQIVADNGGAEIGADYRHWAKLGAEWAASAQAPAVGAEAQCKNCGGKGYADSWSMDGEYNPSVCEDCDAHAKYRAAQEASRDAARLDFIEADHRLELKNNSEMIDRGFTLPRWSIDIPLPFDRGYENVAKGDTLRAAIDAAMKSKPPVQGSQS